MEDESSSFTDSRLYFLVYSGAQLTVLAVLWGEITLILISDVVTFHLYHFWERCKYETHLGYILASG